MTVRSRPRDYPEFRIRDGTGTAARTQVACLNLQHQQSGMSVRSHSILSSIYKDLIARQVPVKMCIQGFHGDCCSAACPQPRRGQPRPKAGRGVLMWPRSALHFAAVVRLRIQGRPRGYRLVVGCPHTAGAPLLCVQRAALASATVRAVMFTMRRTVADGVRMLTGLAAPSSTGPMAMPPPAAVLSRL